MTLRRMSWTARTRIQTLLIFAALVLGTAPGRSLAQDGVNFPATKNPHILKIASLYNKLEYEAALAVFPKAELAASKSDSERLWLELMKGVLYYSLHDLRNSDAAFLRALGEAPFSTLPLQTPSQTLFERFESLRSQVRAPKQVSKPDSSAEDSSLSKDNLQRRLGSLESRVSKASNGNPPSAYADAFARTRKQIMDSLDVAGRRTAAVWLDALEFMASNQLEKSQARQSGTLSVEERQAIEKKLNELLTPAYLSGDFLLKKVGLLEVWVHDEDAKGKVCPTQERDLSEVRQSLLNSTTEHERRLVAIRLDKLSEAMVRCFGHAFPNYDQLRPDSGPVTDPQDDPSGVSLIARKFLLKKVGTLDDWFRREGEKINACLDQQVGLSDIRQALQSSPTDHERMLISIRLDKLYESMTQCFGHRFLEYERLRPE